ncbi:hypothetical protein SAMD00019534_120850 [Acytostelium subglobosum LB1]|uniref:hypothetical protein n=1 Tax=Acytostelium subglobosum LB1 TaxID=1410327 RepID=UPI000644D022|nr:hypothetical protein SAMD00019534_120850 [Acytostelium subglobosum LB1]GAM28909.1 hypothetical protein SAMD00019534_120850 [Acytostelium subglobosum LB1]|eukprot:XP_012748094.1 hypothetical protein SAMD00019534_120850 [Acytostelium subglobosum LB1]
MTTGKKTVKPSKYYNDFENYLNQRLTNETLNLLFEYFIQTSLDQFFKEHPSPQAKQCNFGANGNESIFITCQQCCSKLENYCMCLKCFVNGPHEHFVDHKYSIYKTSAVCDCGSSYMSANGHCYCHGNQRPVATGDPDSASSSSSTQTTSTTSTLQSTLQSNNQQSSTSLSSSISSTSSISNNNNNNNNNSIVGSGPTLHSHSSDTRLFFRLLARYLTDLTCNNALLEDPSNKFITSKIDTIVQWTVATLTKSSSLVSIVCEEFVGHVLDPSRTFHQHFTEPPQHLLPIVNGQTSAKKVSQAQTKGQPLDYDTAYPRDNLSKLLVSDCYINIVYPLLIHLICNDTPFKSTFIRHYIKLYSQFFINGLKKQISNCSCILSVTYIGEDAMVSYLSRVEAEYQSNNIIHVLLTTNVKLVNELLLKCYDRPRQQEYMFWMKYDLNLLLVILKNKEVASFVMSDRGSFLLDAIFNSAMEMHRLSSLDSLPNNNILSFVNDIEITMCKLLSVLFQTDTDNGSANCEQQLTALARKFVEYFDHLDVAKYSSHTASSEQVVFRPHFPVYRMMAYLMMKNCSAISVQYFINQLTFSEQSVRTMLTTVLMFHMSGSTYGKPQATASQFGEYTTMLDLYLIQLALLKIGPTSFIQTFIECIGRLHPSQQSLQRMQYIMNMLVSVIQNRPTLNPNQSDIKYHFIQILSVSDDIKLDQLGFVFDRTSNELMSLVLSEISTKDNRKRTLKKDYWDQIDPHYIHHNPEVKKRLDVNKLRYQLIPNTAPLPPLCTLPLSSAFIHIVDVCNEPSMYQLLLKLMIERRYPNYSLDQADPVRGLFRNYNAVNDCLYIVCLSLRMFKEFTLPSLDLVASNTIKSCVAQFVGTKERRTMGSMPPYCITSLLLPITVHVKAEATTSSSQSNTMDICLLDTLVDLWKDTTNSMDQEAKPLLQHIFSKMLDVDTQFQEYFAANNIGIENNAEQQKKVEEQKKSVSDKRKRLMLQMRQQQQNFSPEIFYANVASASPAVASDQPATVVASPVLLSATPTSTTTTPTITSTSTTSTTTTTTSTATTMNSPTVPTPTIIVTMTPSTSMNNIAAATTMLPDSGVDTHQPYLDSSPLAKMNEALCVICNSCSSKDEPLYAIGTINKNPLLPHHQRQEFERLMNDTTLTFDYRISYQNVRNRLLKDINTVLQSTEGPEMIRSMLPMAFPYIYPSYITSCHHNIHKNCLAKLHPNHAQSGFKCPLCSNYSTTIIPLTHLGHCNQATNSHFITSLALKDMRLMKAPVIDKFVWKYIIHNIETLELKSRQYTLYTNANDDPYYVLSQAEFEKELLTLSLLFNTVMSNANPFTTHHDLQQANSRMIRAMDPFNRHAFIVYLLHHQPLPQQCSVGAMNSERDRQIKEDLVQTMESFYNQIILHYIFKEKPYTNAVESLYDIKKAIQNHPLLTTNINNLLPFMRKMYLFYMLYDCFKKHCIGSSTTPSSSSVKKSHIEDIPHTLTLEQFSSMDHIMSTLGYQSIHQYIQTVNVKEFERQMEKQQCYPFPLRPYDSVIKFIDLPQTHFMFLKDIVYPMVYCSQCKQLVIRLCLLCNHQHCSTNDCDNNAKNHTKNCPAQACGLFVRYEDPSIFIMWPNQTRSYKIYRQPDGYSATSTSSTSDILYTKGLKKIYRYWIKGCTTQLIGK